MSRRAPLESSVEDKTCAAITTMWRQAVCLKIGHDGWPDRLVLLGDDRHFWIEFKKAGKPLRADQYQRAKDLMVRGDTVLVIDDAADGMSVALELRHAISAHVAAANVNRFAEHHAPTLRALRIPERSRPARLQ